VSLKLVPFDQSWVSTVGDSGAPLLDIKAIYRRPSKHPETFNVNRDHAGFPIWDIVGGLPIQHHAKWLERGFEYVTLAGRADLVAVYNPDNREKGIAPPRDAEGMPIAIGEFIQNPKTEGPWHPAEYQATDAEERTDAIARLAADIQELGRERAELLRQRDDRSYRIPAAFMAAPKRGRPRKSVETPAGEAVPA